MTPGTGEAAKQALEALQTNLRSRSIMTRMDADSLAVLNATDDVQVDTITVRPWVVDSDRLWFFDCTDTAIAEVRDVIGAAVVIVGHLVRAGHHV